MNKPLWICPAHLLEFRAKALGDTYTVMSIESLGRARPALIPDCSSILVEGGAIEESAAHKRIVKYVQWSGVPIHRVSSFHAQPTPRARERERNWKCNTCGAIQGEGFLHCYCPDNGP